MPQTVLASTRYFDDVAERMLIDAGFAVRRTGLPDDVQDSALDAGELDRLLDGVDAWILGAAPATRERMLRHPGLKVIARRGVGYDNVDVEAARALNRRVTIAVGGNEAAVADHTLGMMLALAKRLREGHAALAADQWPPLNGTELFEKTVGLIGFGRTAQAVAKRLRGFDARLLVHTRNPDAAPLAAYGAEATSLPDLLAQSDYVSLHAPLTPQTRRMLDEAALALCKPGAIIVNTARGGLIDEDALFHALADGRLRGAGLDVFEGETDPARRPALRRLLALPNVVATAHAAGSSDEGLIRTNRIAVRTVIDLLQGREPAPDCVVV